MTETPFIDHDLIARIEAFLLRSGMGPTAFGRAVTNDTMLITDLKAGRDLRGSTRRKIENFLAENDTPPQKKITTPQPKRLSKDLNASSGCSRTRKTQTKPISQGAA